MRSDFSLKHMTYSSIAIYDRKTRVRGAIYSVHVSTTTIINDVWLKETCVDGTIFSVQVLLQKMTCGAIYQLPGMALRHEYSLTNSVQVLRNII